MRTRTSHARLSFRLKLLNYLVSIVVLTVLLLILAVAFPAFCVWLTVRFVNRGWRPRRRFWLFMPLVLATGYVLSVGPLNWCYGNGLMPTPVVDGLRIVFSPLDWLSNTYEWIENALTWYINLWG